MKVSYRGYEIDAHRAKCMAGYGLVYWSIFRERDGFECASGYSDDADTIHTHIRMLKQRVDAELAEADPWGETASPVHSSADPEA